MDTLNVVKKALKHPSLKLDVELMRLELIYKNVKSENSEFDPEKLTLSEFKWLLSLIAITASFYNNLGYSRNCEKLYAIYVKFIEQIHS